MRWVFLWQPGTETNCPPPPPPALHIYTSHPPCISESLCISGLHKHTRQHPPKGNSHIPGDQARRSATFSHTPDLRGLEREREVRQAATLKRVRFSYRHEYQMQCTLVPKTGSRDHQGDLGNYTEVTGQSRLAQSFCKFTHLMSDQVILSVNSHLLHRWLCNARERKSYFIIVKDIQQLNIQYNPLKFNQRVGKIAPQQTDNNKSDMINFIKVDVLHRCCIGLN